MVEMLQGDSNFHRHLCTTPCCFVMFCVCFPFPFMFLDDGVGCSVDRMDSMLVNYNVDLSYV